MAGRPPPDPYYPIRKYSDPKPNGQGLTFTDTSYEYKNRIRVGFTKGQQLYDQDWNNNSEWFGLWLGMWAFFRRNIYNGQTPPYYNPGMIRQVLDVKHSNPSANHADFIRYTLTTTGRTFWYAPMIGAKAWVDADRMLVLYTASGWKPVARLLDRQWDVEIAIFACGGKKGEIVARKRVSQPFRLTKLQQASRGRFMSKGYPYAILRNGVQVGSISQGDAICRVSVTADVDFVAGDVLSIRANQASARKFVAVTIVGTMI